MKVDPSCLAGHRPLSGLPLRVKQVASVAHGDGCQAGCFGSGSDRKPHGICSTDRPCAEYVVYLFKSTFLRQMDAYNVDGTLFSDGQNLHHAAEMLLPFMGLSLLCNGNCGIAQCELYY